MPTTRLLPVVPGEPETRSTPFIAWFQDLSLQGYSEEEYSVTGLANLYGYADEATRSHKLEIIKADTAYTSRILIRRPLHPGAFNGTVYLEVLNATAGWDGDPIWQSNHEYMLRRGAVWVGVTTKPVTVDFLREGWAAAKAVSRNTSRYHDLSMPHFGQVWDLLSQIGLLLRASESSANPLSNLDVKRLIMVGYSQSADYLVTYANAFHANTVLADGSSVYDGYFISAGSDKAKHVSGPTEKTPEDLVSGDPRNLIQVRAPVIRFQSQTEVIIFDAYRVRQSEADYPKLRFFEMAGGSHVDAHLNVIGGQALTRDLGLPPSFCPAPDNTYNPIRIGYVQSALLDALDQWIAAGVEPPASQLVELAFPGGAAEFVLDANGNAAGGIRPPELQVPLGTYLGTNSGSGFCFLYGGFEPFDDKVLKSLYPHHDAYVRKLIQAIRKSELDGFLLSVDAAALREQAVTSPERK